jgi:hypothetical protein
MGHSGAAYDTAFTTGLPPMNYDAMMSLQNQVNQGNGQDDQQF